MNKTIISSALLLLSLFQITALQAKTNAMEQTVKSQVAETADQVSPLLNGQMIPDIAVTTVEGNNVQLADYLNGQKTILFFYRGGWCPFCNTQMGQLQAVEGQLKKLGFKLVGISTDAPDDLKKSIDKRKLSYDLLSDYQSKVSSAFGLSFFTSEQTTKRYLAKMNLKNPLQKNQAGDERLVLPVPAIYVIDSKGLVQFNYVNPNYKVRLHSDLLLKAAELVK
ncbi:MULTISPECIES: peroxiredoxin-like family protein [Thalassotalea]|uniref:thioredoxin-dependent peroxiredoxin n=1 Tax=Thalassotalea castellviae TaxID=3075612 RepID=A0ABU3A430_9GAMM|nr:peroxiredoxin-like family protein [Thalassotalea sp. W431]MDT0604550.1 peroxiredoxin-like family protein [Thalassotalea sp. W431]